MKKLSAVCSLTLTLTFPLPMQSETSSSISKQEHHVISKKKTSRQDPNEKTTTIQQWISQNPFVSTLIALGIAIPVVTGVWYLNTYKKFSPQPPAHQTNKPNSLLPYPDPTATETPTKKATTVIAPAPPHRRDRALSHTRRKPLDETSFPSSADIGATPPSTPGPLTKLLVRESSVPQLLRAAVAKK